ncbi:cyclase family protein [Alcaligenaceae bacterium]|nr:cyclase family protein [Alcaligenaceae bacterium]
MRWKNRPEGSNWGDFGPDDQLGRLNLITPTTVKQAALEIKEGRTFCLSLPLDFPGGNALNVRRHPPELSPTQRDGMQYTNFPLARLNPGARDVLSDDKVTLSLQYSTQWDSLAHVGALFDADGDGHAERVYYNGFRPNIDIEGLMDYDEHNDFKESLTGLKHSNAKALDITNMARHGIQGRGVMVDLAAHFGREAKSVDYDTLMRVMEKDNIKIESGDILVIHTEFAQCLFEMEKNPDPQKVHNMCATLDGNDTRLRQWITDSNIAAIAADNYAVETHPSAFPNDCCAVLPLHHHCLFKLGLPLAELWYLTELATWLKQHQRTRFFLTAPPLRLPGAVGSPVTPIATV